ncbi:hypothetical protein Ddye_023526 [Dipteronia dyeriana]|uniref:Uncharacterized protein n=1 Tax=Dipteronia dyeriana TaxID=168575 RepID=A0AAD9WTB6_9ROSI|nr:hypothetical protein Ddye_023526 [Dipteronia dyeriana]
MAEMIVSPIAEILLGKLGCLAYQEARLIWGFKTDLLKLEKTLKTIKAVLLDAEQQQLHNNGVRVWLEELKDVCYDAEDVLDEFEIEALQRQATVNRGSITQKVWNSLSWPNSVAFRFTIGHKIKKIRERLDEISANKAKFHLTERVDNRHARREREMTHSFVFDSEVIGRDKEKEEIIELLTKPSDGDDRNISVIPIVGMGGLGKTALVQSVYNNERIDQHFDLKVWVCVSEEFVERPLMISIIKSLTGQNRNEMDIDQLQRILRDALAGKRYLLVMDDVWNENAQKWMDFEKFLLGGANGSKIVVTTRSKRVASIMSTTMDGNGYNLEGLSIGSCLSLFMNCAFKAGQERQPNLVKIGEEIVKKCGGVPLAVKSMGSLLLSSTDEYEWKNVRDKDVWNLVQNENNIMPVLKMSYDHLPSYLKQCLALCSIFPKDYQFNNFRIIPIWMANGILQSHEKNEELEHIGIRYLMELESSSFLQEFMQMGNLVCFKMHDLIHDLVLSISNNECSMVNSPSLVISKKVRHVSFVDADIIEDGLPSFVSSIGHSRTILFPSDEIKPDQSFVDSCVLRFPRLRVLDLNGSNTEVFPKKIGNLKHLRYLDLSGNRKLKKLSKSICKLQKLETLVLSGCSELKEIPRELRYLINLRRLSITTKQKCLPENIIGCFNSLRFLGINGCENLEYLGGDIGSLKALQTMVIGDCPSLLSLPCDIKYSTSLKTLSITRCEKLNLRIEMEEEDSRQDLNSTRIQLQSILIRGLPNVEELPQWLLHGNTLESLAIAECPNFMALPESLQNLQSLQLLGIWDCPKLISLPEAMHRLISLRRLGIEGCPALSGRCNKDTGEDWHKIAHIPWIILDREEIKSPKY